MGTVPGNGCCLLQRQRLVAVGADIVGGGLEFVRRQIGGHIHLGGGGLQPGQKLI
ncbi:hypothetical protein D3C81_2102040 [compost metagenome]